MCVCALVYISLVFGYSVKRNLNTCIHYTQEMKSLHSVHCVVLLLVCSVGVIRSVSCSSPGS